MSFDADDEILQDFLIEAGEILEKLSEQLVGLEQRSNDHDLLNAIFRGFHTVKGGAGFLQLNSLVEVCHTAENVFDMLRNGRMTVSSELMDVVLQVLDAVNRMFSEVKNRSEPTPADPALLAALERFAHPERAPVEDLIPVPAAPVSAAPAASKPVAREPVAREPVASAGLSDDDLSSFMDAVAAVDVAAENSAVAAEKPAPTQSVLTESVLTESAPAQSAATESDEITDEEFEKLLDQLHGKGGTAPLVEAPVSVAATEAAEALAAAPVVMAVASVAASPATNAAASHDPDQISDDEFERLLDTLHGKGKGPVLAADIPAPAASAASVSGPAVVPGNSAERPVVAEKKAETPSAVQTVLHKVVDKAVEPSSAAPAQLVPAPMIKSVELARPAGAAEKAAPVPMPAAAVAGTQDTLNETTVRVDTKRLDDIMNMVGELVLVRNRLVRLGLNTIDEEMSKAVANLDVVTADLQMAVMKTRMQPIKKVFGRFPRVVRDLARNLKKEVELVLVGEDTDLDKNLVEALADPLVHLVRNAVDHGVELPAAREAKGKPRMGSIMLAAEQEGDHIVLSISDDGGGMDPGFLRKKAVEKGLMDEEMADRLSDQEAFALIFHPGFSTKDQVSDISGRGVGMDVVKTKISQLNGSIDITSVKDKGTTIAIKVPLTLAIMPTLMVMLGTQTFALPLVSVNEIFHMDLTRKNIVDGQDVIIVREKALPLFYLKHWLIHGMDKIPQENESQHVVIVNVGMRKVGFVVDQLIGQEEVVIKPLGSMLQGTPGMAGATITGDGRIALILDVPSMLKRYANA